MKRTISIILALLLLVSLSFGTYAADFSYTNGKEELLLETANKTGNVVKLTCSQDRDGTTLLYEYHNNELFLVVRLCESNNFYEMLRLDSTTYTREAQWERVYITPAAVDQVNISNNQTAVTSYENDYTVNRYIGTMNYYNSIIGQNYAISCRVYENYLPQETFVITGTLGYIAQVAASFMLLFSWMEASAAMIVDSLITYGLLALSADAIIEVAQSVGSFNLSGSTIEQRIIGTCISHSGKPTGDLGEAYKYTVSTNSPKFPGSNFYYGYTTASWGTAELGSQMFNKVFGVAYTPTSWTY